MFATIEQKIHCSPRWFRLFFLMKDSTSSVVMDFICSDIWERLSSGKLSSWVKRCSFIFEDSSSVIIILNESQMEL